MESSLTASIKQVTVSFGKVVQSEIELAKAEFKDASQDLGRESLKVGIFALLAVLALIPFIAFLVLGLAKLLDDNYWLSALIVSLVLMTASSIFGIRAFKKMPKHELNLPLTRQHLRKTK